MPRIIVITHSVGRYIVLYGSWAHRWKRQKHCYGYFFFYLFIICSSSVYWSIWIIVDKRRLRRRTRSPPCLAWRLVIYYYISLCRVRFSVIRDRTRTSWIANKIMNTYNIYDEPFGERGGERVEGHCHAMIYVKTTAPVF